MVSTVIPGTRDLLCRFSSLRLWKRWAESNNVGPKMYEELKDLPIEIEIYAPYGTPIEKLSPDYLEKARSEYEKTEGTRMLPFNNKWLLILEVVHQGKQTTILSPCW